MKKQYTTPEMEILKVNSIEIICTSARFGYGTTSVMHANQRSGFLDEEGDLWDE